MIPQPGYLSNVVFVLLFFYLPTSSELLTPLFIEQEYIFMARLLCESFALSFVSSYNNKQGGAP